MKALYANAEDEEQPQQGKKSKLNFKDFFKDVDNSIDYDLEELKRGIEVEHEHTSDPKLAEMIAKQHLVEDPKYYTKIDSLGL